MRTGTKLNDSGPYRNMFFASVTYNNDLAREMQDEKD